MNISILFRASEYRGDHSADVAIAINHVENETIEQLVGRIRKSYTFVSSDLIEIRIVQEIAISGNTNELRHL